MERKERKEKRTKKEKREKKKMHYQLRRSIENTHTFISASQLSYKSQEGNNLKQKNRTFIYTFLTITE